MFKKKNTDTDIAISFLKKTALIFDINANPPTENDINERMRLHPDREYLIKSINKKDGLNIAKCMGFFFVLMVGIGWIINESLLSSIAAGILCSLISPLLFFRVLLRLSKDHELLEYIDNEKERLEEINESHQEDMLNFCKLSTVCMNYKNKVVAQKRPLLMVEYHLFKNQIEKERKEAIKKELYSTGKEQEKESCASYSL